MNLNPQSPFASKASQLLSWGHWFAFANIAIVLLISLGYLWADSVPTTWLGRFYMVITWLSHTSFLTFIAFVLTIFPLSLIFPYPRHIRGMASVIATFGLSWLCLDTFVYFQLGYHINLSSISEIVSVLIQTFNAKPVIVSTIALVIVILFFSFELIVSNFAWRHLAELKSVKFPRYAAASLVTCFALSHSIHIWADANSYFDITKQDNVLPLSYPTTAKSLLAKHNLIDIDQYKKSTQFDLGSKNLEFVQPQPIEECNVEDEKKIFVLVFSDELLYAEYLKNNTQLKETKSFIYPTVQEDSLFNLLYGLPAIYKRNLVESQSLPAWSRGKLASASGFSTFSYLTENTSAPMQFVFVDKPIENFDSLTLQVALMFSDKSNGVINNGSFYSNIVSLQNIPHLIQPMDITTTLLSQVLNCASRAQQTTLGVDLKHNTSEQGVNYSQNVFVAYKKDRITLIKSDGSYQQLSASEGFIIEQKLDIPFLIQSIKQLKQFGKESDL